jgi:DNA-directed RNA polymerase subunit RPC12/RpoP
MDTEITYIFGCIDCGKSFKSNSYKYVAGRFCHNCKIRHILQKGLSMRLYEGFTDSEFAIEKGLITRKAD